MLTLSNTNYNGDVLERLYLVLGVGNEVMAKNATNLETGISTKRALPRLFQTPNPIGDYVAGSPVSDTATTTYAERELIMQPMTVYEKFSPTDFHDIWELWQSAGDFTNLELNSQLLTAILDLYGNNIGTQMSKLFFQGDLAGASDVNKFDGIVTRAIADGLVIKPTPAGVINIGNVINILGATWDAIPDKFLEDPDFSLYLNTADFKLLQRANLNAMETTTGVLRTNIERLFLEKRIRHFQGMPKDYILGAKGFASRESNLHLGVWVDPDMEVALVDKVANDSREWFIRLDFKADANYVESSDLVLYEPA